MSPRAIILVAGLGFCVALSAETRGEPTASRVSEIRLSLLKPAVLSVGTKIVEVDTLESELRALGVTAKTPIIVHLDAEARPAFVRSVYSVLRKSGYQQIDTRTRGLWFVDRLYPQ